MMKVLLVDDQIAVINILEDILIRTRNISIVGKAKSGEEAIELLNNMNPDIIILDVFMPGISGFELLEWLEENKPTPVILLSNASKSEIELGLEAFESRTVSFIRKPDGSEKDFLRMVNELLFSIKDCKKPKNLESLRKIKVKQSGFTSNKSIDLIAIGASTGGTQAIDLILRNLPTNLPPMVIVQHMPEHFTKILAIRLNHISELIVSEARHGDILKIGNVYIAPGGQHCLIRKLGGKLFIELEDFEKVCGHKPSVDVMFRSIADGNFSRRTLAILLTGMGKDGAEGLLHIKEKGGITIGQDEKTSVVYGMPREAQSLGAVMYQLPIKEIPEKIKEILL